MIPSRVALPALTVMTMAGLVTAAITAREERVAHDLTPTFEKGAKYEITNAFEMTLNLDDAEMKFGEMTLPQVPTVNVNIEMEEVVHEEVKEVENGQLAEVVRIYDDSAVIISGEAGMGEMMEELDEEEEVPLSGRTLKIVKTDDGVEVTDLTNEDLAADEQLEELSEQELATVDLESHFEFLLPSKSVEVGESWDIGKPFVEKMTKMMTSSAAAQEDPEDGEMMKEIFGTILESMESEATGKLESVDGDIATIRYNVDAKITFDDFATILEKVADQADEMPDEMDGEVTLEMSLKGVGKFDMSTHQMSELEMGGDFEIDLAMTMSQMDMEISMAGAMSGSLELGGGVVKK